MTELEQLQNMKLHEIKKINPPTNYIQTIVVVRVPGGWIYTYYLDGPYRTSTFVPEPPLKLGYNSD